MKTLFISILLVLSSITGYSQKPINTSVGKINKEVRIINKKLPELNCIKTESSVNDSTYGILVSTYKKYLDQSYSLTKGEIIYNSNNTDLLVKEELYFKDNCLIYVRIYDYATGNTIEVYFKSENRLDFQVNGKNANKMSNNVKYLVLYQLSMDVEKFYKF